jgi:hypothetical protein
MKKVAMIILVLIVLLLTAIELYVQVMRSPSG